jgi:hypothetical protein
MSIMVKQVRINNFRSLASIDVTLVTHMYYYGCN